MFNNLGKKLKGLAIAVVFLGNISSIIYGGSLISQGDEFTIVGLVVMFVGILSSWFSAWSTYALGELIDVTKDISDKIYENSSEINQLSSKIKVLAFTSINSKTSAPNVIDNNTKGNCDECITNICEENKEKTKATTHSWRCMVCDEMRTQSPCEHCGAK